MPYSKKKLPDEEAWEVINEDGDVKAKHTTEEDADKQIRLLHMLEKEHGE